MKLCSITPAAAGGLELRVYEVGHAADSDLSRSVSLKIISTETMPPVASLIRLAESYDGRRSPLSTKDRCEGEHFTASAKAAWLMRPFIQAERQCGVSMPNLCHWQSPASSSKVCLWEMDLRRPPDTIAFMAKQARPRIYLGDWLEALEIKNVTLANAVNKGESHISLLCSNEKGPSIGLLLAISAFLKVSVNDLYRPPPPAEFFAAARAKQHQEIGAVALELFMKAANSVAASPETVSAVERDTSQTVRTRRRRPAK